jgi:filamentous hemagglutinin
MAKVNDSYDAANKASALVGAIKTGAQAVNQVSSDQYHSGASNASSENMQGLSHDVNSYLSVSAGISSNKSESHRYNENTVMNQLGSEGNIVISSGKGSVVIEGSQITTDQNLRLEGKQDVVVKSSQENYAYSNQSSSAGVSVGLNIGSSLTPINVNASYSQANGSGSGTKNTNSQFDVGGSYTVVAGETSIHSGANVVADQVDIQAKDILIESVQDTESSKGKSSGFNLGINFGTPAGISVGAQGTKSKGETEWVSDQTSIIAKNGGTIEAEDHFSNRGGIIGSESEDQKVIVKAETVTVEHLEDKIKNDTHGGGIQISGVQIPNISVVEGKKDKEQDTNATAINTEFEVGGKKKSAEELGFNTDLEKAQVITKDEEYYLDVDLHTDLLNQSEREKISKAGEKIGDFVDAIVDSGEGGVANTYKENRMGHEINQHFQEDERLREIIGDPNISLEDKQNALNDSFQEFLTEHGYTGPMPLILIGDRSATIDSSKGLGNYIPGVNELIVIDANMLNSPDFFKNFAHEYGHLNTYDTGEGSAQNFESKITVKNEKTNSSEAHGDYLASLRPSYEGFLGVNGTNQLIAALPDAWLEYATVTNSFEVSAAFAAILGTSIDISISVDPRTGKAYRTATLTILAGMGTPNVTIGYTAAYLPTTNAEDLKISSFSVGGSMLIGTDYILAIQNGGFVQLGRSGGFSLPKDPNDLKNLVPELHFKTNAPIVLFQEELKSTYQAKIYAENMEKATNLYEIKMWGDKMYSSIMYENMPNNYYEPLVNYDYHNYSGSE